MHSLISKLFEKRNIKDTKDLDEAERVTFDRWERILSGSEVTVAKIAEFCRAQRKIIETGWSDLSSPPINNGRRIILHSLYGTLLDVIEGPKAEREALEKYLNSLLVDP